MNLTIIKFFKRIYKLRFWSGFIISLPPILACIWYSWNSYDYIKSYNNINLVNKEIFQIVLHDLLNKDKYNIFREKNNKIDIPFFELKIKKDKFEKLLNEKNSYVSGKIKFNGKKHDVRIKIDGKQSWNHLETKKSLKIKVEDKKSIIDKKHEINLKNPSNPMLIGDKLYFDISKKFGLLSLPSEFALLKIKEVDMGLYQYTTEIDEIFLRNNRRVLGNIYSFSNKNNNYDWYDKKNWKIEYSNSNFVNNLDLLLSNTKKTHDIDFIKYAENYIDIEKFALQEAIDIIFGNDEFQSFSLYFDPYKIKWEPITSSFDGFKHQEKVNLVINPLFNKLHKFPNYLDLRNKIILKLLKSEIISNNIKLKGQSLIGNLSTYLVNDSNWKSNKLLPKVNNSYRQLMRPMSLDKLETVFYSELETLNTRAIYLNEQIKYDLDKKSNLQYKNITLGGSNIYVNKTKIFDKNTIVNILPNTTFNISKDVSLIFLGRVNFNGTKEKPIRIKSASNDRWGGLVLQGKNTKNSYFKNVILENGSFGKFDNNSFSGMVNIHDTENISIENTTFKNNNLSDDLVHIAYVKDLNITNSYFEKAFSDSLDIEYSNGSIKNLKIKKSGDDGIDLMGSIFTIENTLILASKNNSISSGEESNIKVKESIILNSKVGILTKNGSKTLLENSLIYKNNIGLELNQKSIYYDNESNIKTKHSFLYNNVKNTKETDGFDNLKKQGIHTKLKNTLFLTEILEKNLNISNLNEIESWIEKELSYEKI